MRLVLGLQADIVSSTIIQKADKTGFAQIQLNSLLSFDDSSMYMVGTNFLNCLNLYSFMIFQHELKAQDSQANGHHCHQPLTRDSYLIKHDNQKGRIIIKIKTN